MNYHMIVQLVVYVSPQLGRTQEEYKVIYIPKIVKINNLTLDAEYVANLVNVSMSL